MSLPKIVGTDYMHVQPWTNGFTSTNRQLDSLEISVVYDKSNKHTTVYGS